MSELVVGVIALLVGGAAGVYIGVLRGRRDEAAVRASLDEVRGLLASRETELGSIRQALETERVAAADGRARLESAREHFAEQRRQIEEMEKKVKDTFAALSAAALKNSNEQFVVMAETRLRPLREQLERYEQQIRDLEKHRAEAYGGLTKHLQTLHQQGERLSSETSQLVSALRQPGAKGKWGEITLQRIVEMLGMSAQCDFETQTTLDNRTRPDLIVKLPGNRLLAIDSKVNTTAYLDAINATAEVEKKRCMERYVSDIQGTVRRLSAKEYWKQLSPSPEFVVMFMPGEAFFSAAISAAPDLLVDCADQKVLPASPTTLIALLLAIRHGWQQQQVAENAQRIADAGRQLYDRLCVFAGHMENIRTGIQRAADSYNKAIGSWTSNAMPGARKLKELGAAESGRELSEIDPIEVPLRRVHDEEGEPLTPEQLRLAREA